MSRLPIPGQDDGTWGSILNEYLSAAHNSDGTLKDDAVNATNIQNDSISEDKLDTALAAKVNAAATGVAPDATPSVKGIVRLQGDLSGTADTPTVPGLSTKEPAIAAGTTSQYYRGDKSWQTLNKTAVGLANVDNTSDASKPVSSATQTALNAKANDNAVVHLTGSETISGIKNFSGTLQAGGSAVVTTNDARLSDQRTPLNASVTPAKLSADSPASGELLSYNGTGFEWVTAPSGGGGGDPTMGGDLSGLASNAQIVANAVGTNEIAANAVTTAKILDNNITEPKLAVVNSPSINQVLSWNGSGMAWTAQASGSGGTRTPYLMVASAQAPADVKAAADYLCDGTNDDVMINQALQAAGLQPADPDDFSSVGGYGKVLLSAGTFDITAPLLMRTGVTLEGMGNLTELRARGISTSGPNSIIALADDTVHLTRVTNMWLNGNYSAGNAHGIHYIATGGNNFNDRPLSSPDASHWIDHLYIYNVGSSGSARNGIWLEGASSGPRGCKLTSMRIFYIWGNGIYLQASDAHLTDIEISTERTGSVGFIVNGGNSILTSCKAWYCELDGFQIVSGRASMINCCAQDNGRWGFNITGSTTNIVGGQADSNQRLDSSGGGVVINPSGTQIVGMSIFDRAQTVESPQTRGIQINGTPSNLRIDANINVPSGSEHVVGNTGGTGNLITVVRNGLAPLKVG